MRANALPSVARPQTSTFRVRQNRNRGRVRCRALVRFLLSLLHPLRNDQTDSLVVHGTPRALSAAGLRCSPEGTTVRRSAFQLSRVTAMEQSETPLTSTR